MFVMYTSNMGVPQDFDKATEYAYHALRICDVDGSNARTNAIAALQQAYEAGAYAAVDYASFEDWLKSLSEKIEVK